MDSKYCPLMVMGTPGNPFCKEEECAWWHDTQKQIQTGSGEILKVGERRCAILEISAGLQFISMNMHS